MKILDIAASHGFFGIAVAQKLPKAEIYALDWANVLEVAKENAAKQGLAGRYHLLPGSAFDVDYGTGFDAILITNLLHHFEPAENEKMLKKAHAALNPGGQVLILEFVPNDDRVSPPVPAMFSLTMLGSTPKGDAYTLAEYADDVPQCRIGGAPAGSAGTDAAVTGGGAKTFLRGVDQFHLNWHTAKSAAG